jgi:hypothetical protein
MRPAGLSPRVDPLPRSARVVCAVVRRLRCTRIALACARLVGVGGWCCLLCRRCARWCGQGTLALRGIVVAASGVSRQSPGNRGNRLCVGDDSAGAGCERVGEGFAILCLRFAEDLGAAFTHSTRGLRVVRVGIAGLPYPEATSRQLGCRAYTSGHHSCVPLIWEPIVAFDGACDPIAKLFAELMPLFFG